MNIDKIRSLARKIIRSEYGYGGPIGTREPFFEGDIWIVPIGIFDSRGLFPDFEYRKLISLDLGTYGCFEFYKTGDVKFKTPWYEILPILLDRRNVIKMRVHDILEKGESKKTKIEPNGNIGNIMRKIFNVSYDNGTFFIDRDFDWISEDDIDGIEDFAWDLKYLENKRLIEYTDLCRECNGDLIIQKGYYPVNTLIELAYNAKNVDDLVNKVLVVLTLDDDINCNLWK
jgi:hypothetical protein